MRKYPLGETHLDAVRGLIKLRGFNPVHQQEELVGAMLLRSTRTNRSSLCQCQGLDSKLKNVDYSSLLIFSIFSQLAGLKSAPTYILYQYISSFRWPWIYHIVFSSVCFVFRVFDFGSEIWHFQIRRWRNLAEAPWLIFTTQVKTS